MGEPIGARPTGTARSRWLRWAGLTVSIGAAVCVVAAVALAVFTVTTTTATRQSAARSRVRALAVTRLFDAHVSGATTSFSTALGKAIGSRKPVDSLERIDERVTGATGASYTMILWPLRTGLEDDTHMFDGVDEAGNTDAHIAEVFEYYVEDAQGDSLAGVGDVPGDGPGLYAGRSFRFRGKTGYALACTPLRMSRFDDAKVRLVPAGTDEQLAVPPGAMQLDLESEDLTNVDTVLYVPNAAHPSIYVNLADWDGEVAGQVALSGPDETPDARQARVARPYALAILAALALGLPLGLAIAFAFREPSIEQALQPDSAPTDVDSGSEA